ncbi:hypothetical protein [Paenisporosarcina sp. TG20]|uniref:hypothetical protein n=1 Tax=Paenisporosarcina sp. TG20 TaxID=1211706 RepID=UPI000318990F|nr:hypothetical protein [Paenisporosarcina sp. TG20]
MKDKLTNLRMAMDKSVFKGEKFTSQHKQEVLKNIKRKKRKNEWFPRILSATLAIIFVVSGTYLIIGELNDSTEYADPSQVPNSNIEPSPIPDLNGKATKPSLPEEEIKDTLFDLTSIEEQAYDNFKKDLDLAHLADLEPISVAKLHIYSSYNQDTEVLYALYTDREERILWTKEEDEIIPESDRGSKEQILALFEGFENGTFIKTSEYEGYIEFKTSEDAETKSGFQMIQNVDGIWQVAFMPIQ